MGMDLPRYCIVGRRPVKAVATADGGMDVLAFDWDTGAFVRDMRYLVCLLLGEDEERGISALEVDFLTEEAFEQYVRQLGEEHDHTEL